MLKAGPKSLLVNGMVPLLARATLFDGAAPASGVLKPPLLPSQVIVNPAAGVMTTRGLAAFSALISMRAMPATITAIAVRVWFNEGLLDQCFIWYIDPPCLFGLRLSRLGKMI